jgi:hypothetical protein
LEQENAVLINVLRAQIRARLATFGGMSELVAITASVAITGLAFVIVCLVPALPTGRSMRDFVAVLDGAYKISHGLVPHVDFAVPHGAWPLYQAVPVLYLLYRMQPLLLYQFVGWLSILPAGIPIAMRQPNPWRAVAVLAFVAMAALIPCVVEYSDSELAYYGGYNRFGAAFLFLTLVWILTPLKPSWPQALLVAYLLFMLLATKVTFFVAGFSILVVYGALTPFIRPLLWKSLLVLAGVLLAVQSTSGMVMAYVHDIRAMAAVNEGGYAHVALTTAVRNFVPILAAAALLVATLPPRRAIKQGNIGLAVLRRPVAMGRLYRVPIMILVAVILTVLVESQSTGGLGFGFLAAFSIASLPLARKSRTFGIAASVALLITSISPWISNVVFHGLSVVTAQIPRAIKDPSVELEIPRTVTVPTTAAVAEDYAHIWLAEADPEATLKLGTAWMEVAEAADSALFVAQVHLIDEAIAVAKQRNLVSPSSHTMTIGDVDYFTRVLGTKPAEGIALWHNRRTFLRPSTDKVRTYMYDVDVAFAPHCGQSEGDVYIVESFAPALQIDFDRQPLTRCWDLWVRRH